MHTLKHKKIVGNNEVFTQSPVSQRFLEVVDELKSQTFIKSDSDLCERVKFKPQSFSQIRKGKRNATIDLVTEICQTFPGNPLYIFLGKRPLLLTRNFLKAEIASLTDFEQSETEFLSHIEEILKPVKHSVQKRRTWHERIEFLADLVRRLEVGRTISEMARNELKAENKTLLKIINTSINKGPKGSA